MVRLFIDYQEERDCVEMLGRMKNENYINFLSLHASNADKYHHNPSQQRLLKLRFLQKLGCQNPCWDLARLSSLVNRQFGGGCVINRAYPSSFLVVTLIV